MYPHGDHGEWPLQVSGKHPASEEQVRVFCECCRKCERKALMLFENEKKELTISCGNVLCYIIYTAGIDNIYGYIIMMSKKKMKGENCEYTFS